MTLPQGPQHVVAWEVSTLLLQILSIGSTIVRIVHRSRTKRMWWDDWIAFIPLSVDAFLVIIDWLAATAAGSSQSLLFSPWFGTFMYFTVVWVSRISLSLSIARIFPPRHACRRLAFGLTVLFIVLYIPNVLMPIFECENQSIKWFRMPLIDCVKDRPAPSAAVFTSLALDFVADILLIVTPLTMLWKIRLPRRERILILTLFSSSILSLMASISFCIVWALNSRFGSHSRMIIRMVGQIQAAIALLVCNLLVVTMMLYCILTRKPNPESGAVTAPAPASLSLQSLEETGGTSESEKDSSTNVATNRQNATHGDVASRLHQDSTIDISFTTIFEDSLRNSSLRSGSLSKLDTRNHSFEDYEEDCSRNSSDSRFPAWSFSAKSTDTRSCS